MGRLLRTASITSLAILAGCVGPVGPTPDDDTAPVAEEVAEGASPLMTGETFQTQGDTACQRHQEPDGKVWYLCLVVTQFADEPANIWRAKVCKAGADASGGVVVETFVNDPIVWRVSSPSRQLTLDTSFNTNGTSCTEYVQLDMRGIPCGATSIIDAEVLSPASCTEDGCRYRTGGLIVRRECPREVPIGP